MREVKENERKGGLSATANQTRERTTLHIKGKADDNDLASDAEACRVEGCGVHWAGAHIITPNE